ncbi:hypothetical protein SAMN04487859_112111 [Roseovarius lutimaris]|uniref:Uncharacterized protein n=2 Tax=Roseovarius lutimaris TaxID=1005928 RepID=A0A1I5DG56_9RHOB|nr:hypothetical protein SAMN04487859_112111 [Roseovarius lutimaris]
MPSLRFLGAAGDRDRIAISGCGQILRERHLHRGKREVLRSYPAGQRAYSARRRTLCPAQGPFKTQGLDAPLYAEGRRDSAESSNMTARPDIVAVAHANIDTFRQPVVYMHEVCQIGCSEGFAPHIRIQIEPTDGHITITPSGITTTTITHESDGISVTPVLAVDVERAGEATRYGQFFWRPNKLPRTQQTTEQGRIR